MIYNLKIVKINKEYCNYLRKFDNKVSYNYAEKENRPFVGILFRVNSLEYFAPLSSPKEKHLKMKNMVDFFKIDDGKLGVINFNNMIPVSKNNYDIIDLKQNVKKSSEKKYKILLENQLSFLNANIYAVYDKSNNLYKLYINNQLPKNIKDRCCNFPLLEEKCEEYNNMLQNV